MEPSAETFLTSWERKERRGRENEAHLIRVRMISGHYYQPYSLEVIERMKSSNDSPDLC